MTTLDTNAHIGMISAVGELELLGRDGKTCVYGQKCNHIEDKNFDCKKCDIWRMYQSHVKTYEDMVRNLIF